MEGSNLLAAAKVPLRKKDLELLAALGITEVNTEGTLVPAEEFSFKTATPPPEAPPPPVKPAAGSKSASTGSGAPPPVPKPRAALTLPDPAAPAEYTGVYKRLGTLIQQLDAVFREVAAHESNRDKIHVSVRQLWTISATLLQLLKEERAVCLGFVLSGAYKGFQLAKSAINTAILAITIAREMQFKTENLSEIAAGALLHDIGMFRIPQDIVGKQGQLTVEETALIHTHTTHSYNIITRSLACSPAVGTIALQHHERWDGTGYPQKLVGNAIDTGARVICIADAFEAMASEKSYRQPLTGYFAMKNIVSENAAHFAPATLKAFVRVLGMYPIGSGVALSDGRIARVIDVSPEVPLRPVVQVIADVGAKKISGGQSINLARQKQPFITQALDISGML